MDLELLEALALSGDRSAALAQLLPGSEDHDYYRALHAQQRGALDEAEAVLRSWPERHGHTPGYDRLRARQLLYRVTASPPEAVDEVRDWLGVSHWHEPDAEIRAEAGAGEVDPSRPSRLPDGAFDPVALLRQAAEADANLSQVTDEGISELVEWQLEPSRRRVLLGRLGHTPQPQVVGLVLGDLTQRSSVGFGALAIHRELTLDQLHELAQLHPELRGHAGWVAAVVTRMRPPAAVDLELDRDARAAYLDELWRFAGDLPPASNSLKAHVLWHLLDTARQRARGIDGELFRTYLALPRAARFLARGRTDRVRRDEVAELGADFAQITGLPPAGDDEELVRDAVQRDLAAAETYAPWLDRGWLDAELAAARLLAGEPDADRATLVLGPARAAALRDRIELAFCPHNPTWFAADAPVALDVEVKHVAELVVKVFRIDPLAYFHHHRREVDAGLDLDGLAASDEHVLRFTEPPVRRVRRRIELLACARPGSYVVDLIGNGMSSRAVIHKGRLRHVMRVGAAGHVITILDEDGRPRPDARAWIGDREYVPDERGAVVVPFSTSPARTAMLLLAGDVASVAYVDLVSETARLALRLMLDHQALTAGRTARAIARLGLTIGGAPAALALLRQATWDVTLTDRHGVSTTRSQPLELTGDDAAVLEWQVGDDTAEIALTVRGRVEIRSEQREHEIRASRTTRVASMYAGTATEALYLASTSTGWVVSALGLGGEPRAHRPVTVGITHRWARTQLTAELATDERGRIELGELPGAQRITATLGGATQSWELDDPPPSPAALHATAGRDVIVPIPASRTAEDVLRRASLVELRAGVPARHPQVEVELLAGALAIRGLLPGNYQLRAHGLAPTPIVVTAPPPPSGEVAGWAVGAGELVQVPRPAPAIAQAAIAQAAIGEQLTVRLHGGDARTRVHLIASRFAPALVEPLAEGPVASAHARLDPRIASRYVSGRELGDEYRYVLERRSQPRFPGLLLDRPSLLLNPWARRTTTTDVAEARAGGAFPTAQKFGQSQGYGGRPRATPRGRSEPVLVGYDFLAAPPVVLANLVPDDTGAIVVPLAELGAATTVTAIVDDPAGVTVRRIALPEPPLATRDLRLQRALDPDRHATQRKQIVPLIAGAELVIEDLATARVHLIDSVERAHAYLLALRDDADLRAFSFVTRWHALADAERRALYSKHACHELHLFLYFRDRAFFDAVIRPYLAHKRVQTFIDHWLLDADLAPYTEPARLAGLNAFERALLARRVAAGPAIARLLGDEVRALPPDPGRDAQLIDALLGGATLDADADIAEARQQVEFKATESGDDDAFADSEVTGSLPAEPIARFSAAAMPPPRPAPPPAAARPKLARRGGTRGGERGGSPDTSADDLERDVAQRGEAAPMFRAADKAQEWAEHNWWHRTPAQSGASMIGPSRLWRELADHTTGPFLSPALGLAAGSFAEAMCALAVTDLPFVAPRHAITSDGPRLTIAAAGNALAGSSQLAFGELVPGGAPLVVGMSYVRADDRQDWSSGEPVDKYVDGPLATGVVYTCLVVLANPTSSRQRVAALVQIPRGSIALAGARPTHTIDALLEPYGTHGHEVSFYFPAPGRWSHFPVHVSRAGQIVAAAPARTLEVRTDAAAPDVRSWPYLSQRGELADVVAHLAAANLSTLDLPRVAWRLRERAAYDAILGALEARCAFDATLWGYALLHADPPRIRAWLRARAADLAAAGPVLDMIGLDGESLGSYEHLELAPLINARAHRLGPRLRILNDGLAAQYHRFLDLVAHRRAPAPDDLLAATHYLLAQDRVPAALAQLARVNPAAIAGRMQHDYLAAFAACLTGELGRARELASRWRDHPVDRWRLRFAALAAMLDEVAGAAPEVTDPKSRDQQHAELAARQPTFDLAVDRDGVVVHGQHVAALELRFFEMDIELLFSRQPFMQSDVSRLSYIEPAHREAIAGPAAEHRVAWPVPLRGKNVVVEAVGAGLRKARAHYANDLVTTLSHQYGQLRVQRASNRTPLAATYVKVYARQHGGQVAFYKDGYTDLRGWFDYASLSTTELDAVERFAILVCSDHAGAAILEASPPAR